MQVMEALVYHGPGKRACTVTTPLLLELVESGRLQPGKLVTHRFGLADTMKAYDTFGNAAGEQALKVILRGAEQRERR